MVLAPSDDADLLIACFGAPIDGLILKSVSGEALVRSLQLALAGERVFPARLVGLLLANHRAAAAAAPAPEPQDGEAPLSEREIEIVRCLVGGDSNKAIADRLDLGEATVRSHLKSVLRKIRVGNRTQAAIWAVENGLVAGSGRGD